MDNRKVTNSDTMRASAIARKVNDLMNEKQMTRRQFIEAAGISESTLSKMLSCKVKTRESTLRWMEDNLGLPHMYFSTNIKKKVPDDRQLVLEVPEEPKLIRIPISKGVWLLVDPKEAEHDC